MPQSTAAISWDREAGTTGVSVSWAVRDRRTCAAGWPDRSGDRAAPRTGTGRTPGQPGSHRKRTMAAHVPIIFGATARMQRLTPGRLCRFGVLADKAFVIHFRPKPADLSRFMSMQPSACPRLCLRPKLLYSHSQTPKVLFPLRKTRRTNKQSVAGKHLTELRVFSRLSSQSFYKPSTLKSH